MSWLEKLPPKIQPTDPAERRSVPEGLWISARRAKPCSTRPTSSKNLNVSPSARTTIASARGGSTRSRCRRALRDRARVVPVDALKFRDSKKYPERLKEALEATGETDALVVMGGAVKTRAGGAACFEFDFMGGSMGSVVGERFARGVETAIEQKTPFISFTATGGARMQEGPAQR